MWILEGWRVSVSQVIVKCSILKEVFRGRTREMKLKETLVVVHQFDILLKEVCEIAYCCWKLGKRCGNAHSRNALARCVVPTHVIAIPIWGRLFCNRSCCFPSSCTWSRTADDICVHKRQPQQVQSPAAGLCFHSYLLRPKCTWAWGRFLPLLD